MEQVKAPPQSVPLAGNVFAALPPPSPDEQVLALLSTNEVRIERIVSTGQASPADFWYDQDRPEWVMLLAGSAKVLFADEAEPRPLAPGDYIHIPAHTRHRVAWTDPVHPTIWLAIHHR